MNDRITDEKLDHLIHIQDMLRCQMAHTMAADDGFHESNVHAGLYRALVELKALREAAGKVVERWDTPLWKDAAPTAEVINALRRLLNDQPRDP